MTFTIRSSMIEFLAYAHAVTFDLTTPRGSVSKNQILCKPDNVEACIL